MPTRFIGLDLAWSPRNNSAAAALEAQGAHAHWIAHRERLGSDEEVLAFVRAAAADDPALVAIDAPLVVPNQEGARPVDREITRLFGRCGAGCYPANRNLLGSPPRGEAIVAALAQDRFLHGPSIPRHSAARHVFEVYPHPATIALFHLKQTLKYKPRPHRTVTFRRQELTRLRAHLRELGSAEPAMSSPASIMERDLNSLQGSSLKCYEDLLDSAVCAYIAHYAWYWGPDRYSVYGDTAQGYILVPMPPWLRQHLGLQHQP